MDIRDILKSFDQLTEGDSTVHKAGPGGYGNRHGTDDVTDQYGKPIGQMSLGKLVLKMNQSAAKVVHQTLTNQNHMTVQH
jgi:hypothetical protein